MMKKLIGCLLVTVLLCVCLAAAAFAEEGLSEIRCDEWHFSTRIPAGWNASMFSFDDPETDDFLGGGFTLTSGGQDLPQVWIVRRDHFFNVGLYLQNSFYYYLWDYGIGQFDTEGCKSYHLGGRTLYGASAIEETQNIDYQTDEAPVPEEPRFLPSGHPSAAPDLQDSEYLLRVEDADKIETDGYFTAALYKQDCYSEADVRAMQPGDTILIQDLVLTIVDIDPRGVNEDGSWYEVDLIAAEHAIKDEYYSFTLEQVDDGYVAYFGNDNHSASRVGEVRIQVPSSESVAYYCYDVSDDDYILYSDDLLGKLNEDPAMFGFGWNEYNHSCRFKDGQLVRIDTWDYPYGPDDSFMH